MPTKQIESDVQDADYTTVEGKAEDISDLQDDLDAQLSQIFTEFGGDPLDTEFRIKVLRVIPNQAKREHCFECVPSELPIVERVREEYGPGSYEVWIYKSNKIFKRQSFHIAQQLRPYRVRAKQGESNSTDTAELVRTLLEENRAQLQAFKEMLVQRQPAPVSGGGMDMAAMMTVMLKMKEFLAPPSDQGNNFTAFLKGIETVKELDLGGGEKGIADVVIKMAEKFGPGLMAISQQAARQPARPAPRVANAGGEPAPENRADNPAPETPRQPTEDEVNAMQLQFQQQLNMLVFQAKNEREPAVYAEMILDNIPEDNIRQLVDRPDWLQYLAGFNTEVSQHGEWFGDLRECLLEGLTTGGEGNHNPSSNSQEAGSADEIHAKGNTSENT